MAGNQLARDPKPEGGELMVTIPAFWCGVLIAVGVPVIVLAGAAAWFIVRGMRHASSVVLDGKEQSDDSNS